MPLALCPSPPRGEPLRGEPPVSLPPPTSKLPPLPLPLSLLDPLNPLGLPSAYPLPVTLRSLDPEPLRLLPRDRLPDPDLVSLPPLLPAPLPFGDDGLDAPLPLPVALRGGA